jgi:hypothetical protein
LKARNLCLTSPPYAEADAANRSALVLPAERAVDGLRFGPVRRESEEYVCRFASTISQRARLHRTLCVRNRNPRIVLSFLLRVVQFAVSKLQSWLPCIGRLGRNLDYQIHTLCIASWSPPDDHYESVTQCRKWTNCPSTKVETIGATPFSAAVPA